MSCTCSRVGGGGGGGGCGGGGVGGLLSDPRAVVVLVGVVAIQGSDGEMMRDQCSESL